MLTLRHGSFALALVAWIAPTTSAQVPLTRLLSTHDAPGGTPAGVEVPIDASADGRFVVFEGAGTAHVAHDTNGRPDVFLCDALLGTIEIVSLNDAGQQANGRSGSPVVSDDGQRVAFISDATNLIANDTNGRIDVFLRDRAAGTTTLVSRSTAGVQGVFDNGVFDRHWLDISANGAFVVFSSYSGNLVLPTWSAPFPNAFVHELATGITTRISHGPADHSLGGYEPCISNDGRYVAYLSDYWESGAPSNRRNLYLRDLTNGTQIQLDGTPSSGDDTQEVDISDDGSTVVFATLRGLQVGDTNGVSDVYAWDVATGVREWISRCPWGQPQYGEGHSPAVSADGRFVSFYGHRFAANHSSEDLFVCDRSNGTFRTGSIAWTGGPDPSSTTLPARVSADGRTTTFIANRAATAAGGLNNRNDVVQHIAPPGTPYAIACSHSTSPCPCPGEGPAFGGCRNSTTQFATLTPVGNASLSNDTLVLVASVMPNSTIVLFFQGTSVIQSGAGVLFGDGVRCAGGTVRRLGIAGANLGTASLGSYAPGQPQISVLGEILLPDSSRLYQAWFRDTSFACTPATFNLTDTIELVWTL